MSYTPLLEWLDANSHRKFPFEDSATTVDITGALALPTSLMVDLFLCVPVTADVTKFYVKSVMIAHYFVEVVIGYVKPDLSVITVGRFSKIPTDQPNNSVYYIETDTQPLAADLAFTKTTGALVIGRCTEALENPGYYEFTPATGLLLSSRISQGLAVLQQITVNSKIYTGNFALREGDNILLTPRYDALTDTTTVTVSARIGSLEDLVYPLVDDASVLQNLTELYGRPIATINNIQPDLAYNLSLLGEDCTAMEAGTNSITFKNACNQPCCDKSMLDAAYAAIAELNRRYARMEAYYESIGRNVNEVQARMVALEIP